MEMAANHGEELRSLRERARLNIRLTQNFLSVPLRCRRVFVRITVYCRIDDLIDMLVIISLSSEIIGTAFTPSVINI